MKGAKSAFQAIYEIVKQIPKGRVATYGQVAALAGNQKWSRVVGNALHANPNPMEISCHRVVNVKGELAKAYAFGGVRAQESRLREEGVVVVDGKVDLERFLWKKEEHRMYKRK